MRILHLDSGTAMRGGQWQALRLVEGLAEAGHRVTLLAPERSPCLELARKSGFDARQLGAMTVLRLSRQMDLVHAHDAHSHTLAAIMSAAPFVVSRRVGFPVRGGLSRWKYSRALRFIAVSNYVKGALIASGVGADKITVVYDGVPLLPSRIQVQRLVVPASSDPRKGTALALEAARLTGVSPVVSKDLERDLPGASLFLYITHSEGLGSGILLAMSAGVPVVASRIGGIPEIVEDGVSGLLVSNRAEDIAAAILRLQEDPTFAARLAGRGRQEVEERFTLAAMVAGTMRAYERALSCPVEQADALL
jgi:glycosyltransferase involved in cell wall biosynthesis